MKFEKEFIIPIIFFLLAIVISTLLLSNNRVIYEAGFVEQGVWNTLHGDFFYEINNGGNHFARHNSPILFIFLPIYYLFPNIIIFMLMTNLFIALGSIPVYMFARKILKSRFAGITFMVSFLLFPSFLYSNLRSFHPIMLSVFFMSLTVYFMYKRKWNWFMVSALISMLTNETVSLTLIFLGLFVFFKFKQRVGLNLIVIALVWFIFSTSILIPHFNNGSDYSMVKEIYGHLGNDIGEVIKTIVTHPIDSFQHGFVDLKIKYLRVIFEHNLFTSLLAPELLLVSIPIFVQNIFSSSFYKYDVVAHYIYPIIPIIIFASIIGVSRIIKRFRIKLELVLIILFLVALLNSFHGLKPLINDNCQVFGCSEGTSDIIGNSPTENVRIIREMIDTIPAEASVQAQNHVYSKVSDRRETFLFAPGWETLRGDYFILDLEGISSVDDLDRFVNQELVLFGYELVKKEETVYLFKHKNIIS